MTFYDKDMEDYRISARREMVRNKARKNKIVMGVLFVLFLIVMLILIGWKSITIS